MREDELAQNLSHIRRRIELACAAASRDVAEITLIAITKTWPASDVRILAGLGISDVGENRDQEAKPKAAELSDLPLTWHAVGQVQRNKARSVAQWAQVIHSVDRPGLVEALERTEQPLSVLIQVNLDPQPVEGRGGCPPDLVDELAGLIAGYSHLTLRGVMGVAPLGAPPGPAFAQLAQVASRLRTEHPAARWISAGMSHDLEAAILHGATHLRIGSAILGSRLHTP